MTQEEQFEAFRRAHDRFVGLCARHNFEYDIHGFTAWLIYSLPQPTPTPSHIESAMREDDRLSIVTYRSWLLRISATEGQSAAHLQELAKWALAGFPSDFKPAPPRDDLRLRAWLGRISTPAGYNVATLQAMARQALAGESPDAVPDTYKDAM